MPVEKEKSVSRLLIKVATAVQELGSRQLEKHLDSLISNKTLSQRQSNPVIYRIECVVKIVSRELKISIEELKVGIGTEAIFGLSISYYLIKMKAAPGLSQKEIANYFNRSSHSQVNRAIKKINNLDPQNRIDRPQYEQLKAIEKLVEEKLCQK